jgi:pimeloyl-ACP methyl ester carboxylesterase
MGGTMGMMLAARHPERVGRLMVVDQVPFAGVMFGDPNATPESVRPAADKFRDSILADTEGKMIGTMVESMVRDEAMKPTLVKDARDSDLRTVAHAMHELLVTDLRPDLGRIKAPITVVYVQPAAIPLPREQFDGLVKSFYAGAPATKLVRFEDANHYLHLDQPQRFVTEVDAFMR